MDITVFIARAHAQALETLAWSEIVCVPEDIEVPDDIRELDGKPFDETISWWEVVDERGEFREQVEDFVRDNWDDIKDMDPTDVGHNFVLSKNHHGTGFWDRGLGELGDKLHKACDPYGNTSL